MRVLVFIFLIIILTILFIPIGVRIIYDNTYSDIDVFIFKNIKYKFDLDNFIRKFIIDELNNNKISFTLILKNIELIINSKKIITDILKTIRIEKSTIIFKQDYDDYFRSIVYWNIVSRYTYIIRKRFKKVSNEYYMISDNKTIKNELCLEIIFELRLINIILMSLKNISEVIKVLKIRRRKKHGTSNL